MKGFHPPKQASLTHWYKAATAQIDAAPDWRTVDIGAALVDANTIIFEGHTDDAQGIRVPWMVMIARRRHLR